MIIYLYHKRHAVTGLNYFGKTTTNPYTYSGSGKYWAAHLKKHGAKIETIEVWAFTDQDECTIFALLFSEKNNIVESAMWANLKPENGRDGGNHPSAHSESAKLKRKATIEARVALGNPLPNTNSPNSIAKGNITRAETFAKKQAMRIKNRGPDTKPRKPYIRSKPFVNRNTPESLAKRAETAAKKKLTVSAG